MTEANKEKDTVSADQKATEATAAAETTAPAAADDRRDVRRHGGRRQLRGAGSLRLRWGQ